MANETVFGFHPEEIEAARRREEERIQQHVGSLVQLIHDRIRTDDAIASLSILPSTHVIGLELLDGTELFVTVEPA